MLRPFLSLLLAAGCVHGAGLPADTAPESWLLVDQTRQRKIPVAVYEPRVTSQHPASLVLMSHGYGMKNTDYGFLARALAASGALVLSVQHDLPGDPPLPTGGDLYRRRRPVWTEGVR